MSGTFWRLAAARGAPVAAATVCFLPLWQQQQQPTTAAAVARCDAAAAAAPAAAQQQQQQQQPYVAAENPQQPPNSSSSSSSSSNADANEQSKPSSAAFREGMQPDAVGTFHNLFPMRQLFVPAAPYPLWNKNWDGRQPLSTGDAGEDRRAQRRLRQTGVTRHIILVRHGQYDETHKDDAKRILTPLGREQAHLTGRRIAEMVRGCAGPEGAPPCQIRALRASGLARAIETAEIIASHLPGVELREPDAALNEGRPCHTIPGGPAHPKIVETTDHHHPRIEAAFRKLFYRADAPGEDEADGGPAESKHEFEIIVCHANVIRYWLCRALQLPPEAWLRYCPFNCSLTYLTIRPTGTVSCRMLGDIGHLPYSACTFSGHHGYNW